MTPGLDDFGLQVTEFLESVFRVSFETVQFVQVAIDGSGPDNRDTFVAFGAVVGLRPEWDLFHKDWLALLRKWDLSHIRMADAMSFRGPFEAKADEWGDTREQKRDQLLEEAAGIIRSRLKIGGTSFDSAENPPLKKPKHQKEASFQFIVLKLLEQEPGVLVFMCDDDQEVAVEFYKALDRFKREHKGELARRIGGICFFDDERVGHLQAADMAAYVLRQESSGRGSPLYKVLFTGEKAVREEHTAHYSLPGDPR